MTTPVWTTETGKLATFIEDSSYELQLEATSDETVSYSIIAGSLPPGLSMSSTGLLTGIPSQVATKTLYKFVVRATAGTLITDRSFSIEILGADAPTFTTASGQLRLDDSTISSTRYWVIDGSSISLQIQATDDDTRAGQQLVYEIVQGELPPGVTMTKTGLISGVVQLTDDQKFADRGGYDGIGISDQLQGEFDRTVTSKSVSKSFDFVIRVSDGTSSVEQDNSIFVYSADFWRVSNTEITIDMTEINDSPLTMDLSANRRPVFKTGADLGTFRHDNQLVVKIDVEDFDPLQGDLEYSIVSGSLPTGISINTISGELSGKLEVQSAVETNYTFTVRANRVVSTGVNVFTDQQFIMKVIGDIDIGIAFTTQTEVGTLSAGMPSMLSVQAVAEESNRVLSYEVTAGSLPPGITLSPQGNFVGTIDPDNFTDSTRAYSFTVTVSDQYQSASTSKVFTLNVDIPFTSIQYGSIIGDATSLIDQNIFYSITQDPKINSIDYIYRGEDANFGIKNKPEMLLLSGLEAQTLTAFQNQMEQNHSPKRVYFGDIKTAVAKENGNTKYEVVYIEMKDRLTNNEGLSVANAVTLPSDVTKPVLGPRAGTTEITADTNIYEITHRSGLSFSTSGSKVRYANQLSADLDFVNVVYPNSLINMRSRMKSLGHKEWTHLPLWMRTTQTGSKAPIGWTPAVVICYCKPGTSNLIKKRIEDKNLEFKNIDFVIDRYVIKESKVATQKFVGDGTTSSFVVDELIHEEDILVKEGTETVFVGQGVTADNNIKPTYLTADGTLRSADHELGITLSHDTSTKKTTITFTKEAPARDTIIKVSRSNDKYLKFRNKGTI